MQGHIRTLLLAISCLVSHLRKLCTLLKEVFSFVLLDHPADSRHVKACHGQPAVAMSAEAAAMSVEAEAKGCH